MQVFENEHMVIQKDFDLSEEKKDENMSDKNIEEREKEDQDKK